MWSGEGGSLVNCDADDDDDGNGQTVSDAFASIYILRIQQQNWNEKSKKRMFAVF